MSTKKRTKKEFSFGRFGGIDYTQTHGGKPCAEGIVNFRLLADGSLRRREGTRLFTTLNGSIRAITENVTNGICSLLVLAGNTVSSVDTDSGAVTAIGTVGTSEGNACFFYLKEELYLTDGSELYRYDGTEFKSAHGYVPIIGLNWTCGSIGPKNEPINILNHKGRITYVADGSSNPYLYAGESVEGVEAVYVNGNLRPSTEYSVDKLFNAVVIPSLREGDTVDVRFLFKDDYAELRKSLFSSTSSALFGDATGIRIFLCGGGGTGKIFQSRPVTQAQLYEAKRYYPYSDNLYFPADGEFNVCNGKSAATAILRFGNKLLAFTESDVWMISSDGGEGAQVTGVNSGIGCPVIGGAALSDNDPFSIGRDSVWHWSETSLSDKNCKAINISVPIGNELNGSRLKNCGIFYSRSNNEIWIYSKNENIVWVYGIDSKAWYTFTGISGDRFFDMNGQVAFCRENKIFIFDKDLLRDIDENGNEAYINATYSSGIVDPMDGKTRTLRDVTLRGDLGGMPVTVEFIPDTGDSRSFVIKDQTDNEHSFIHRRAASGRFKYGKFKLSASPSANQLIHSLTINAR